MRLAPPAPGALWREICSGGARIDTEQIPEGFDVGVCTFAICHNPEYFPDPYVFDPERFLNKGTSPSMLTPGTPSQKSEADYFSRPPTTTTHLSPPATPFSPGITPSLHTPSGISAPTAFAPFLLGPRSCVAKPFAYLEMSLALARLIYCLDFRAADATGEGVPGSGVMGRERKEEFHIVDMFGSSKEGPVLEFKKR